MHLFRITVHKCHDYSNISISVQQKKVHSLNCFEITQTMTGVNFLYIYFKYSCTFCLKYVCEHLFLNKHYYFYFNEEAGQNFDCIIH